MFESSPSLPSALTTERTSGIYIYDVSIYRMYAAPSMTEKHGNLSRGQLSYFHKATRGAVPVDP